MELDKETLAEYIYDPNRTQQLMLNFLEGSSDGNLKITEPTNPFVMLMEAAAVSGSNAVTEPITLFRKLYADLAQTPDQLVHHLSDAELANMFSVPAEAAMIFYVNVKDIKSNGNRPTGATYTETILPIGTEVTVANTTFTLLNKIYIKLYDEGIVFVEQENNDNDIAISSLGVLSAGIISFKDGEPWVIFETTLKQVKKHTVTKTISATEGFDKILTITDKYFYSEVKYKNSYTNNNYQKLLKTHAEDFINTSVPTVYIKLMDKQIEFKIPDTYLIDGLVSGNGVIDIYETKGKINLPINKYKMEEFKVNIEVTANNVTEASIANINVLASSRMGVEGGKDSIDMEELRSSIINNSTGDIDVPITTDNIKRKGEFDGFEMFKALDIVTERVFIASKNLPDIESKLIFAKPDIFFNKLSLTLSDVTDMDNVLMIDDYMLIKSGTVFKENNYKMEIVRNSELDEIKNMTNDEKLFKLQDNKYFFTPYHYVIDTSDKETTTSRVYDLENPILKDIKIIGKNTNVLMRVNTDQYGVFKTSTGYKVVFTLITNKDFDNIDPKLIKGQFSIPLIGKQDRIYFKSEYDQGNKRMEFNITTDLFVDKDDFVTIKNGFALISNKLVSLLNTCEFIIYSAESNILDNTHYLQNEIVEETDQVVVFNKESIHLTMGTNIKYIWNKFYNTYTERMYKKHEYDLPMVYKEDVYKIYPETGTIFHYVKDEDNNLVAESEIIHKQGDPILDTNDSPVYKFRKGDIILDEDDKPMVDTVSGIVRNIDIMMLEYEFKVSTSSAYVNYLNIVLETIADWLYNSMPKLNNNLLENTTIQYRSYKTAEPLHIKTNNSISDLRYNVKPKITLYSKLKNYTNSEVSNISNIIGNILHEYLNNSVIHLSEVKDTILETLGKDIVGVKIENIDTVNESEVFTILDNTKRLILDKKLTINKNNDLVVNYALDININTL